MMREGSQVPRIFPFLLVLCVLAHGAEDRLLRRIDFDALAPEDIARDTSGALPSYWVTSFLDSEILRYDADWSLMERVSVPAFSRLTGIAYNAARDTLFVVNPLTIPGDIGRGVPAIAEVFEIDKDGTPTGTFIELELDPLVNPGGRPSVRGLAYVPESDYLDAALLVFESVAAKIYCFALDGTRLFSFVHVDDGDGYPGYGTGVSGGGLLPVLDEKGMITAVEFMGHRHGEYVIHRMEITAQLEPIYGGFYTPLTGVSGQAAGLERGSEPDPDTGEPIDVFYVPVDTQHQIFVFRTDTLPLYEPFDLTCENDGDDVVLTWENAESYDRLVLLRNGGERAVLPGTATSFRDGAPPGSHRYELGGERDGDTTRFISCEAVVGPGQVLRRFVLDMSSASDLTVGPDDYLWIIDPRALEIVRYDPTFDTFEDPLPVPLEPSELDSRYPARIACDRSGGLLYVVVCLLEPETYVLHTFNGQLEQVADPVPITLYDDPDTSVYISALMFSPTGNGGQGSILLMEANAARIFELSRGGEVLANGVRHPDWDREPPPEGSRYGPYVFGMTRPAAGGDTLLDVTGGLLWDRRATRILRIRQADGQPTGYEIPLDGMDLYGSTSGVSLQWHNDRLFALNGFELTGVLYELRTNVPSPPPPTDLACVQQGLDDVMAISFTNNGPYDGITIERDGSVIAELPGNATGYEDTVAAAGVHTYSVTASSGGTALRSLDCVRRVGRGAQLAHTAFWPPAGPEAVARHPSDGSYYVTSIANDETDRIYHVDGTGQLLEEIPAPYDVPWRIAAIAVSPRGAGLRITSIGWRSGTSLQDRPPILLTHQSETGAILQGPAEFEPPIKPEAPYVLFPASLHWDRADGFWYLERNAGIMWHIDQDGNALANFPHPAPPTEQFVYATPTSFNPERGVFYLSTDTPGAGTITRLVECTLNGTLTGFELPLDGAGLSTVKATFVEGRRLRVFGYRYSLPSIVDLKAFDDAPGISGLTAELAGRQPRLSWQIDGGTPERIVVERNGSEAAVLAASARSYQDPSPAADQWNLYVVRAETGSQAGPHAACTIFVPPPDAGFIRGDSNASGSVDIADAVYTLIFLFSAGSQPLCLDAADVDDDGAVRINDPVYLLQWMFLAGTVPPPPFPDAGVDTTPDDLPCWP
jgi:hypothetical protein